MLCLETYCAAFGECSTVCTCKAAVPVRGVNLNTGFGCINFHCTAADGFCYLCCVAELANLLLVEYIAVVVAYAKLDLLLVGINACANLGGSCKVECCAFYGGYNAIGN